MTSRAKCVATWVFLVLTLANLAMVTAPASGAGAGLPLVYGVININRIGYEALAAIKQTEGLVWWVELDDQLLVLATEESLGGLERQYLVTRPALAPTPGRRWLVWGARRRDLAAMVAVDVLAAGGRFAVVQARHDLPPELPAPALGKAALIPLEVDLVLARQWANDPRSARPPEIRPAVRTLVDEVDPERWFANVATLASFNRYTHDTDMIAARDWIRGQFQALPGLTVTVESFKVGATTAYNVIATWSGTARPNDWYIVGGHYDATSEIPSVAAPGAEDNASGCAGVLEMARVLSPRSPEATVIFICYSGEEQDYFGSTDHAAGLVSAGDDDKVRTMLNMDMIGFTEDSDLDCLLETDAAFASVLDPFVNAAAGYTTLRIVTSLWAWGSDHEPYLDRGMPALLTIENDCDDYPHYHRSTDLPPNLSLNMAGEILRMNAAALAQLVGAQPSSLIFADGFESGDLSAWTPGP